MNILELISLAQAEDGALKIKERLSENDKLSEEQLVLLLTEILKILSRLPMRYTL